MDCVICATELTEAPFLSDAARACPRGHGIFLSEHDLEAIVAAPHAGGTPSEERNALSAATADDPEIVAGRFRDCPACGNTMRKDIYHYGSGVVIDTCDEHGIWLDPGELSRLDAWRDGMEHQWQTFVSPT